MQCSRGVFITCINPGSSHIAGVQDRRVHPVSAMPVPLSPILCWFSVSVAVQLSCAVNVARRTCTPSANFYKPF